MAPKGRLTPFFFYYDAKGEELREAGRMRVSTNEVIDYWNALSDAERKPFEEKAAQACAAYFEECKERALEGDDGEEDEEEDEDGGEGGDGGDGESGPSEARNMFAPLSRIKRIIRLNSDVPTLGREATFAVTKSTETFLERCVWDAARVTSREKRKTIMFRDVVASMRQHPCPESMQFFVGMRSSHPPPLPLAPSKVPDADGD